MKKTKLTSNFFSAAGKVFGAMAVLFIRPVVAPIRSRVPYFPRR